MYNGGGEESMQRYFTNEKKESLFYLNLKDTHHITKVMRLREGDLIEVVYQRQAYECKIVKMENQIVVEPIHVIAQEQRNFGEVTLIIPLLKEQKMDYILQKATELGVDEIRIIETERSVVKWNAKKEDKKRERWATILKEASEQSKRLTIPILHPVVKINDLTDLEGTKMICSTREVKNNVKLFLQNHAKYGKMFIAVGPEGGFTLQEENAFIEKGFTPVSLGKNILRVETVPLFCLSVLMYEYME